MSTDPKSPAPTKPAAAPAADDKKASRPPKADAKVPPLDERKLKYDELAAVAGQLDVNELTALLHDGRAIVRANAALGLAAAGHVAPYMVTLLRDSDAHAAVVAADAVVRLGANIRPVIPQIAQALDGALPEVIDKVVGALADLIGTADDELIAGLDVPLDLAEKGVIAAAGRIGRRGIQFLIKAAGHERSRIRMNAIAGIGKFGKVDIDLSMGFLTPLETSDPVPDVRAATKQAMLAVIAREKQVAVDHLPKNIPDFEARKLSASELREQAEAIDVDEMVFALRDGRDYVRINASRALAVKGAESARAATAMGLLLRDSIVGVRREAAKALGKIGAGAVAAAPDLVGALGDVDDEVAEAATDSLAPLGDKVVDALVKGLDAGDEPHGIRVGQLIGRLPNAAEVLTEAFASPAVNVQVNAALGLGMLGASRVSAPGLKALHGARTGGDARTRAAVRRALDMIEPEGAAGPRTVAIDGFEDRVLPAAELDKGKAAIEAVGAADLIAHLEDGRDVVRANAAAALGVLGPAAAPAARSLGVRLRDDAARVRLAAAQALDKAGDAAVAEAADDLVGALGDTDEKVADTVGRVLRARRAKMIPALVRGLETDKPNHGRRICELINVFEDAPEILCDAIESAAVNVQVNAALGLGMLGNDRVGKGRKALENRRTGGDVRLREAVRAALEVLDGPRKSGPGAVAVDGFETRILAADAFGDGKSLVADDLAAHLQDGRPVVRANAATALAALGPAAMGAVRPMAVLLRDDDMRVRIAAAQAFDKLGDEAVREVGEFLVGALRGDADVAKAVAPVLAARKTKVLTALVKGLETDDAVHARRIVEVIANLPDACEILCDAFESPAENVQVNAAIGIGMLGPKRAGTAGRKLLEGNRTRGFTRTKEAVFKALAMLDGKA
jgi:HEAT repeat protein